MKNRIILSQILEIDITLRQKLEIAINFCLIYIPIENTCVDSSVAVKFYSAMRLNSN